MANATTTMAITSFGLEGYQFDLPVKGATIIYEGALVAQLTADGYAVPYSTAASGHAAGVATHTQDNSLGADGAKRIRVESRRLYAFANGAGGDAFADTDIIGSPVYGTDDHTAAKTSAGATRKAIGSFLGFEADGRVRVFVDPIVARLV